MFTNSSKLYFVGKCLERRSGVAWEKEYELYSFRKIESDKSEGIFLIKYLSESEVCGPLKTFVRNAHTTSFSRDQRGEKTQ